MVRSWPNPEIPCNSGFRRFYLAPKLDPGVKSLRARITSTRSSGRTVQCPWLGILEMLIPARQGPVVSVILGLPVPSFTELVGPFPALRASDVPENLKPEDLSFMNPSGYEACWDTKILPDENSARKNSRTLIQHTAPPCAQLPRDRALMSALWFGSSVGGAEGRAAPVVLAGL